MEPRLYLGWRSKASFDCLRYR